MTVPVSITLPQFNSVRDPFLEGVLLAEDLGFAGVFVFDHLLPLGSPHRPVLEGVAALGAVAAITSKIRVGTLVMRAGLRGPVLSAAVAASALAVAGERVTIGLGAGDKLSQHEAGRFGMERPPLEARLEGLEETMRLIRQVAPKVRVWLGGRHEKVRKLAATLADGWNAWDAPLDEFGDEIASVRSMASRELDVSWGGPVRMDAEQPMAEIERLLKLVEAGADQLVVSVLPNQPDSWRQFAELWTKAAGGMS